MGVGGFTGSKVLALILNKQRILGVSLIGGQLMTLGPLENDDPGVLGRVSRK